MHPLGMGKCSFFAPKSWVCWRFENWLICRHRLLRKTIWQFRRTSGPCEDPHQSFYVRSQSFVFSASQCQCNFIIHVHHAISQSEVSSLCASSSASAIGPYPSDYPSAPFTGCLGLPSLRLPLHFPLCQASITLAYSGHGAASRTRGGCCCCCCYVY